MHEGGLPDRKELEETLDRVLHLRRATSHRLLELAYPSGQGFAFLPFRDHRCASDPVLWAVCEVLDSDDGRELLRLEGFFRSLPYEEAQVIRVLYGTPGVRDAQEAAERLGMSLGEMLDVEKRVLKKLAEWLDKPVSGGIQSERGERTAPETENPGKSVSSREL